MYSLAQQKEWLEALYVQTPADLSYFENQYEEAKAFARAARGKNGAELLAALLPGFDRILNGTDSVHSTPAEKNFEVTRALYTLMIGATEVISTEIPPPTR